MYTHEERRQLLKLGAVSAGPVKFDLGHIHVGRLPTVNQDDYPGLGDYWVQLRIGQEGEEVLARVYGNTPEQAHNRAAALAAQAQSDIQSLLKDPVVVHNNMCRGIIAPITFDMLAHVLGDDAKQEWIAAQAQPLDIRPLEITDGMALAFHHAITDGSIGQQDVDEIKTGLRAAFVNVVDSLSRRDQAQQPVSGADLSKALRDLIRGYVNLLENGRDRILEAGGQCDSLDVMEASDPWLKSARAALDQQDADKKDAEQWISVNERLPEIHEWRAGSIAGISDAVLTIDEDDPDTMTVQRLRKGGQGDLTTLYWDNGDSPTHWRSAPSLPGIDAARKEKGA